jgi:hypothetical protein
MTVIEMWGEDLGKRFSPHTSFSRKECRRDLIV